MIEAVYYDGRSSRAHPVWFSVDAGVAQVSGDGIERSAPLNELRVSEPMGAAPRLVTFSDGAFCEIRQHQAFKELLERHGHRDRPVVRWQFNFWRVYAALAATVAVLTSAYLWGLPWLAQTAAQAMPEEVVRQIGSVSLENLDKHMFEASELPAARQDEIRSQFAQLRFPESDGRSPRYQIHFRRGGWIGANALALPSGDIVVTDELVALADRDEQILGVLAHEMGHVRYRHGLQMLVQGSAVGLIAAWMVGDISSLLATLPTALAQLAYSRELESQADDYAIATLKANHISPAHLADMLEHLAAAKSHRRGGAGECRNPEAKRQPEPDTKSDTQTASQPEATPQDHPESHPESHADTHTDTRPQAPTPDDAKQTETNPPQDDEKEMQLPPYLSSHPAPYDRIAKLRQAAGRQGNAD